MSKPRPTAGSSAGMRTRPPLMECDVASRVMCRSLVATGLETGRPAVVGAGVQVRRRGGADEPGVTTVHRRTDAVRVIRADVDVHVHRGWPRLELFIRWWSAPLRRLGVHEALVELNIDTAVWFRLVLYARGGSPATSTLHPFLETAGVDFIPVAAADNLLVDLLGTCCADGHFAPSQPSAAVARQVAADLAALGAHVQADWARCTRLFIGTRALMGKED